MRLLVKRLRESPFIVEVTEQMTVFNVKQVISGMTGVLPSLQYLILRGAILSDESRVKQLHLADMGAIYLSVKRQKMSASTGTRRDDDNLLCLVADSDQFCDSICVGAQDLHLSHALNDREFLNENIMAMKNQSTRVEYLRSIDNAMNMTEARRHGFRALVSRHKAIERAIEATTDKFMERSLFAVTQEKTVIPPKADAPNTEPLPFKFFQRPIYVLTALGGGRGMFLGRSQCDLALELMEQFIQGSRERAEEKAKQAKEKAKKMEWRDGEEDGVERWSFWDNDDDEPEQIQFVQKFYDKPKQPDDHQHGPDKCSSDWSDCDSDLSECDID